MYGLSTGFHFHICQISASAFKMYVVRFIHPLLQRILVVESILWRVVAFLFGMDIVSIHFSEMVGLEAIWKLLLSKPGGFLDFQEIRDL